MNTDKFLDNVGLAHLWKRITDYVQGSVPKKMSELKNDMGYTSNGVTSFNGSTGAVVYHGVDTVNGKRGNVQLTIPTKTSELENDSGFITEGGTIDAYTKSQTDTLLSGKQDTIDDLSSIRSGAALGTTALQSYTETDPTVPQWAKASTKPAYTAQEVGAQEELVSGTNIKTINNQSILGSGNITIQGGGGGGGDVNIIESITFNGSDVPVDASKNAAITYSAPVTSVNGNTGAVTVSVPTKVSDLTNDSGFITSYTETDPVFTASAAHGITSNDISNWNSKTSNVGTITGITMNGASKGTSGVVDLGTVITDVSGKVDKTTTINGKALSSNVTLSASDVGALPSSTVIPAAQVNADWNASSGVAQILNKPSNIVVGATSSYTIREISQDDYDALVQAGTTDPNTIYLITES